MEPLSYATMLVHRTQYALDYKQYTKIRNTSFPLTTTIPSMSPTQVPSTAPQAVDAYLVFDILNIFRSCWFLNHEHLLLLVTFAQKAEASNDISWLEVTPQSYSHLVRQALALVPPSLPLGTYQVGHVCLSFGGCQ